MSTDKLILTKSDLERVRRLPLDAQLTAELDRATVVPCEMVADNVVRMNSRVLYVDETAGRAPLREDRVPARSRPDAEQGLGARAGGGGPAS
jgi:hypothetical protein